MGMDITISDHGSIVLITGTSDAGKTWIDEHLITEGTILWGGSVACEPRYVADIVDGARNDGMAVG